MHQGQAVPCNKETDIHYLLVWIPMELGQKSLKSGSQLCNRPVSCIQADS